MFQHQFHEDAPFRTYFGWFVLSFLAGNINAGGLLACGRFVSHVTGFATLAGVSLAHFNALETLALLSIPGYFLGGVMLSAYMIERGKKSQGGRAYAPVMALVALALALVTFGGVAGLFGPFGGEPHMARDYFLLALLCGACGLQNAAITSSSGATVRTTHLTGLTTDLGLGLMRALMQNRPNHQDASFRLEMKANALRLGTIASFVAGSFVGALIYTESQYWGFLVPMLLAVYVALKAARA